MSDFFSMKECIDKAFLYVRDNLFSEKTCLIYDHIVNGREDEFPTPSEIGELYPNPCGYTTGMEDGMISGGTMLDACLLKYERENDPAAAEFSRKLVCGMLNCAESAKTEGFLPRAVSPTDGKSHYPDSSRDQYTMFAFGMHRYLSSDLCTCEEKARISKALTAIARRAEKNVTAENRYDLLTDDRRSTLVTVMWGDTLGNHEYMRLPMFYILAYEASGDIHWLEKYREIRAEAYEKSLPMTSYWSLYTLQQMQVSVRVCYDLDVDDGWREKYYSLMFSVADYAESMADKIRTRIESRANYNAPQIPFRELEAQPNERFITLGYPDALLLRQADHAEYFILQDGAQLAIVTGLVPHRQPSEAVSELLCDAFSKIDLSIHERNLPLYFVDGYYRIT